MYRSSGFRIDLVSSQARRVGSIRNSQRYAYNWAVGQLLADPTLTRYDLYKKFGAHRRLIWWLQDVPVLYQNAAIRQARTAADISNKYGNGNMRFRSRKRHDRMAVECDIEPKYVDNRTCTLPGLGAVRLCEEQPYQFPSHWLYDARSFRLVNVTPERWRNVKPQNRVYRLYVTYKLPDPKPAGTGVVVGIDRGVTNPTVVCRTDGKEAEIICYDTATAFRTNQAWNDAARRSISCRNKHSSTTRKMIRQRKRYNRGNANDREYAEWLLAKKICEGVDTVCIEDLRLEAMTRRAGRHKRGLNRGMRFIRHHAILRKIRIVAERLGIRIIECNPRGTSQTCHMCGHVDKKNRNGEKFQCMACDHLDNADGNASVNMIQRGTTIKVPAGGGMTLERREMGRTRKPPRLAHAVPDVVRRRKNQARNRPATSSAMKHLCKFRRAMNDGSRPVYSSRGYGG